MWSDDLNTTDAARMDFAALLDAFMPLAQGLVRRDGSFTPFAGYLDAEGAPQGLMVKLDEEEDPTADQIVGALEKALKDRAAHSDVQAAVIFADVMLRPRDEEDAEAIFGRFEHSDGSAFRLFLRYIEQDGAVVFHDPSGVADTPGGLTNRRH